jgi:hypothetical protein
VPEGTVIRASIHNLVHDAPLVYTAFMADRKKCRQRSVPFDKTVQIEFKAGAPGTYFYKASTHALNSMMEVHFLMTASFMAPLSLIPQ